MTLTKNVMRLQSDITRSTANFDEDGKYRYTLYREWSDWLPTLVVIGLNPSAANEEYDDRTVRRCIDFAKRERCGSLLMLNIFALRTTNPSELVNGKDDPIGRRNDYYIASRCNELGILYVVCAWGTDGAVMNRGNKVIELLKNHTLYCFGRNLDGSPKHPLYLSNKTKLEVLREKT